jgi:hypothetical protein
MHRAFTFLDGIQLSDPAYWYTLEELTTVLCDLGPICGIPQARHNTWLFYPAVCRWFSLRINGDCDSRGIPGGACVLEDVA